MATDVDLAEDNTLNNQKKSDVLCPAADVDPATDDLNDPTADVNPVRDVVLPNLIPTADVDPATDDLNDHLTADVNPVRDAIEPKSSPTADVDPTADVSNKADEDVHPSATGISPAEDVDLAENKLYSHRIEQKLRQVSTQASDVDLSEDKRLINQKNSDDLCPATDVYPAANDLIDYPTADDNPVRDAIVPNSSPASDVDLTADVPSKADEDFNPVVAVISQAIDVNLAGNKLYSNNLKHKLRQVFAILDDPWKNQRGDSISIFVEENATLSDALKKLNEQSNPVWGFPVNFFGITTKSDRFIRDGHLLKSDLNLYLRDVMLEEDYLVFRPNNLDDHVSKALLRQNSLAIVQSVSEVAETNKSNKIKDEGDMIQNGNSSTTASEAETRMMFSNGKWGREEDEKLVAGLLKYGTKWSQIRKEFDLMYRSSFSLSKRSRRKTLQFRLQQARNLKYGNTEAPVIKGLEGLTAPMNPVLNQNPSNADLGNNDSNRSIVEDQLYRKRNWSADEDEELIDGIQKYGKKWATIYRESGLLKQRSLPALSKRARKKSFVAIYKKAMENTHTLDNLHSSLPAKFTDIITPINDNMKLIELNNIVPQTIVSNTQNMSESYSPPMPPVEAMVGAHENTVSKALDLSKSLSAPMHPVDALVNVYENAVSNISVLPKSLDVEECKTSAV